MKKWGLTKRYYFIYDAKKNLNIYIISLIKIRVYNY